MTSRADRLRSAIGEAGTDDVVAALAGMSVPAVDRVVAALRQARRSGRIDETNARKTKRRNRPKRDDDWVAASATAITKSLASRASMTMETLSLLKAHYDDGPNMLALAVAGARAQGYSDREIGEALGVTPQAVGGRYGPRKPSSRGEVARLRELADRLPRSYRPVRGPDEPSQPPPGRAGPAENAAGRQGHTQAHVLAGGDL